MKKIKMKTRKLRMFLNRYINGTKIPAEIDESAIIGYTNSYTDNEPKKNGETNFNRELNMPYAEVEGGIAVLYQNEWWICKPHSD